jgi:Flp pilus assembly protein TadD
MINKQKLCSIALLSIALVLVSIAGATQDTGTWINKGVNIAKLGKFDDAITACNKAIQTRPHDSCSWYKKGLEQERGCFN